MQTLPSFARLSIVSGSVIDIDDANKTQHLDDYQISVTLATKSKPTQKLFLTTNPGLGVAFEKDDETVTIRFSCLEPVTTCSKRDADSIPLSAKQVYFVFQCTISSLKHWKKSRALPFLAELKARDQPEDVSTSNGFKDYLVNLLQPYTITDCEIKQAAADYRLDEAQRIATQHSGLKTYLNQNKIDLTDREKQALDDSITANAEKVNPEKVKASVASNIAEDWESVARTDKDKLFLEQGDKKRNISKFDFLKSHYYLKDYSKPQGYPLYDMAFQRLMGHDKKEGISNSTDCRGSRDKTQETLCFWAGESEQKNFKRTEVAKGLLSLALNLDYKGCSLSDGLETYAAAKLLRAAEQVDRCALLCSYYTDIDRSSTVYTCFAVVECATKDEIKEHVHKGSEYVRPVHIYSDSVGPSNAEERAWSPFLWFICSNSRWCDKNAVESGKAVLQRLETELKNRYRTALSRLDRSNPPFLYLASIPSAMTYWKKKGEACFSPAMNMDSMYQFEGDGPVTKRLNEHLNNYAVANKMGFTYFKIKIPYNETTFLENISRFLSTLSVRQWYFR